MNSKITRSSELEIPARRSFLSKSLLMLLPLGFTPELAAQRLPSSKAFVPPTRARGGAVLNVRQWGARGNGDNDDTAAFQRAIDALPAAGGTVRVPAGNYVIDPTVRVYLRSRMHLHLLPGAVLRAKRNSAERAYVLMAYKVSDVEISGGRIIGDRYNHLGSAGEWGHAIMIRGSKRVTIRDIHLSQCWGDGISIGGAMVLNRPTISSVDVVVANVVSTGNRRQGLTIGQAARVQVWDSEFSNTGGIKPGAGIDIEPDPKDTGIADTIHIENCVIKNNEGNGVILYRPTKRVTIKKCIIERNGGYGILSIESTNAYITQNIIRNNYLMGIMFRVKTRRSQISGNTFHNNHTRLWGIRPQGGLILQRLVGLVTGRGGTGSHIQVTNDSWDIRVTTNFYTR